MNKFDERILEEGSKKEDCGQYCSHGGYCIKGKGHKGIHDSGFCQWRTKDSLTKEEANKILIPKLKKLRGEK